ncbi:transcriptional regulator [Leuconostoc gasicomitatum]|uniref:helix-turn-helix domain-containing protein n=1 Tax=Leuconostoc gasicomitatum TaxID=115778 RepID=UPI0001DB5819|nr:helix-turn-helix transcriptional regulator [Leuconostoc gasicomitatum]GMA06365.1 transcriptional regulator [Leuconostoc gasicomitatum]CBL92264.1 transcriptional regulator, Cro/CI family [Leuconostoc gasicomitatum LMG 18811]
MTTFERIKDTAKKRGMNLKQVAIASGFSENAIYRYNQGVEPSGPALKAIADTLNVTVNYLLNNSEEEPTVKNRLTNIDDSDILLSFDGKEIDADDKQAIIELLKFRRFQKRNEDN